MNTEKLSTDIVPFQKIFDIGPLAVGNKAYNLGLLLSQNVPVPQGFVLTTDAYDNFMHENEIIELGLSLVQKVDITDRVILEKICKQIRKKILSGKVSEKLTNEVSKAYSHLSGFSETFVAIRSSSTYHNPKSNNEDSKFGNFLNIKGANELLPKIKECWASQFNTDILENILQRGLSLNHLKMAVIIQKMVQAEVSGVMYTVNPIDHDDTNIYVEAILGLGEAMKESEITPDTYLISKKDNEIKNKHIVNQEWMYVRQGKAKKNDTPNIRVNISPRWQKMQKLEDKYIMALVEIGKGLEKIFEDPLEVEWAYESGKLWVVEAKAMMQIQIKHEEEVPVEINIENEKPAPLQEKVKEVVNESELLEFADESKKNAQKQMEEMPEEETELIDLKNLQLLLSGEVGNKGVAYGFVKIVNVKEDLEGIDDKTIVVAANIPSMWADQIRGAAGIVTDESGETIEIAKELGITAVVGTQIGSKVLKDGEVVTIAGFTGDVYEGSLHHLERPQEVKEAPERIEPPVVELNEPDHVLAEVHTLPEPTTEELLHTNQVENKQKIVTATKLYLDLNSFISSDQLSTNLIDGIAVIHSNSLIGKMGMHPEQIISNKKESQKFIQAIYYAVSTVSEKLNPQPVIYQLSDLLSHEYAMLDGGEIEDKEVNPLLGKRSIDRFIEKPDLVKLELDAIKDARNKLGLRNLWISIPYVRNSEELRELKQIISTLGLRRSSTFKIFLNITTPANIISLESLINIDIDGLIVDLDSLKTLLLGHDWKNTTVKKSLNNDEISWSLKHIITTTKKSALPVIVKGEILEKSPELINECIDYGVAGIGVHRNYLNEAKDIIVSQEHKMILAKKPVKKKKLGIKRLRRK